MREREDEGWRGRGVWRRDDADGEEGGGRGEDDDGGEVRNSSAVFAEIG